MKRFISLAVTLAMVVTILVAPAMNVYAAGNTNGGFGVMLDGKNLAFDSNIGYPQNIKGRIMVPYRGLLLAMGADDNDITYDIETKTVKALIDGTTISFEVGGDTIDIEYADGTISTEKMDVVPYIDPSVNRTYVSTRFVSQAFGYGVGWDAEKSTAVVIDWETLLNSLGNGIDNDFSIIGKLLTMSQSIDLDQVYESATTIAIQAMVASELAQQMGLSVDQSLSASMEMGMDALVKGIDVEGTITMNIDADEIIGSLDEQERAEAEKAISKVDDSEMDIKFNGDTGEAYIRSELMDMAIGTTASGVWYSMNIYDLYSKMGLDLKDLMEKSIDIEGMKLSEFAALMIEQSGGYSVQTYQTVSYMYDILKDLIGDEAFTKKTVNGEVIHKATITNAGILAAFVKHGSKIEEMAGVDIAELKKQFDMGDINMNISVIEKNGVVIGDQLDGTISVSGTKVTMNISETAFNSEGTISIEIEGMLSLIMDLASSVKETTEEINVSLPENTTVIDISQLVDLN